VTLTPRATCRITGYAVDTSRALLDEWDFVLPVDVLIQDRSGRTAFQSRTSLSRDDIGSGACEQMWVEAVDVDRP
jgi:hypothetical protein